METLKLCTETEGYHHVSCRCVYCNLLRPARESTASSDAKKMPFAQSLTSARNWAACAVKMQATRRREGSTVVVAGHRVTPAQRCTSLQRPPKASRECARHTSHYAASKSRSAVAVQSKSPIIAAIAANSSANQRPEAHSRNCGEFEWRIGAAGRR